MKNCQDHDCISVSEYLRTFKIPQKDEHLGSVARSNAMSEILFSDLLEFVFNYHVPRYRQYNMSGKTVSEHGTDVIAYKMHNADNTPSQKDKLLALEVKAILSKESTNVIDAAIQDSEKDYVRLFKSLDFMRDKLLMLGKKEEAEITKRFFKKTLDNCDYELKFGGAGITCLSNPDIVNIGGIDFQILPNIEEETLKIIDNKIIYFIYGVDLLSLTHEIFERCVK